MEISQLIAEQLSLDTIEVFGVVGNGNVAFVEAVDRHPRLRYTAVRHEAAAVAAADGYARASGGLAVATTTWGPGFTNVLTPLAESVRAGVPVLVVSGTGPRSEPRPWDVDEQRIAEAAGALVLRIGPRDVAATVRAAVDAALARRTAVVLVVPADLAAEDVEEVVAPAGPRPPHPTPDPGVLGEIAQCLDAAERPLLLVGRGAVLSDAGASIGELAARIGARTAASALGLGLLTGPGDLGVVGGFAPEGTAAAVRDADVVLVLGAGLNPFTTRSGGAFGATATVIQADLAEEATSSRVDLYIRGDADAVARGLLARVSGETGHGRAGWGGIVPLGSEPAPAVDDGLAADGLLDPRRLFDELDRILPADRVIVQDGGHFVGWAPVHLALPGPARLHMVGTAFQAIGLGFGSAVGVGRALPEAVLVTIVGDGGALMALSDLETLIRTAPHGVVVVVDDGAYGAEVHQHGDQVGLGPLLIEQIDFAGVARALGARGVTVSHLDDLAELLRWRDDGAEGTILLDCRVSRSVVAPFITELAESNRW